MEKTSKFWDDLSSHKEQNKGNSRIIHSFVGLIYPNLIEEHCKFTVTENVLISVSVEPSFRGNPQNQESVSYREIGLGFVNDSPQKKNNNFDIFIILAWNLLESLFHTAR